MGRPQPNWWLSIRALLYRYFRAHRQGARSGPILIWPHDMRGQRSEPEHGLFWSRMQTETRWSDLKHAFVRQTCKHRSCGAHQHPISADWSGGYGLTDTQGHKNYWMWYELPRCPLCPGASAQRRHKPTPRGEDSSGVHIHRRTVMTPLWVTELAKSTQSALKSRTYSQQPTLNSYPCYRVTLKLGAETLCVKRWFLSPHPEIQFSAVLYSRTSSKADNNREK